MIKIIWDYFCLERERESNKSEWNKKRIFPLIATIFKNGKIMKIQTQNILRKEQIFIGISRTIN